MSWRDKRVWDKKSANIYDKRSERNQSAASRAPQTRQEPMGRSGGNPTLRARGVRLNPTGVDWDLFSLVGRVHPGKRGRRKRRTARGRTGDANLPVHKSRTSTCGK